MQLFYSKTSPYSRKVRMLIVEKGIENKFTQTICNPFDNPRDLLLFNPLGKVPTLVIDDNFALYDSPVICEYIDSLLPARRLIPESGLYRWQVLSWQALCDGVLDAAYNLVMEYRRMPDQQSAHWIDHWQTEIYRALDLIETSVEDFSQNITLSQICLGAALGYLDFRLPALDWRKAHSNTFDWYETFKLRPSMVETKPE